MHINDLQPKKLVKIVKKYAKPPTKVGVLGLAFKPGTDDIRGSRSLDVIKYLVEEGYTIVAYDPMAMDKVKRLNFSIELKTSAEDVLAESEIVIIATEWLEFRKLDYTGKIVVDGRNVREASKTAKVYEGLCW